MNKSLIPLSARLFSWLIIFWLAGFTMSVHAAGNEFYDAGPFKLQIKINPETPKVGKNRVTLQLQDAKGQAISGASIKAVAVMPAMGSMPAMYAPAEMTEIDSGQYEGSFSPLMAGEWPLTIEIESSDQKGSITFDLATGRNGLRCASCNENDAEIPGTVKVNPVRRQLIGITSGVVRQEDLNITIRAAGEVRYDETRLSDISLKFDGWIGTLYANASGQAIRKGQTLFSVYSPQLLSAQEEYLELLRRKSSATKQQRLKAVRRKLRLWDIDEAQIRALEKSARAREYLPIKSPVNGVVVDKNIVAGSSFQSGQQLLRIADISRVWVEAQVYDYELPLIKPGMAVQVILPELQNRRFDARIDFIYPYMQGDTRTARVRVVLDNPDGFLRPGMYAHLHLNAKLGKRLLVAQSAVLFSGQQRIVFIDKGNGRLVPRKIKTGLRNRDSIEVIEGLQAGDQVVTSGNFLIAAESKLKAGVESW